MMECHDGMSAKIGSGVFIGSSEQVAVTESTKARAITEADPFNTGTDDNVYSSSNVDTFVNVIFYERLEIPLKFISHQDKNCYNDCEDFDVDISVSGDTDTCNAVDCCGDILNTDTFDAATCYNAITDTEHSDTVSYCGAIIDLDNCNINCIESNKCDITSCCGATVNVDTENCYSCQGNDLYCDMDPSDLVSEGSVTSQQESTDEGIFTPDEGELNDELIEQPIFPFRKMDSNHNEIKTVKSLPHSGGSGLPSIQLTAPTPPIFHGSRLSTVTESLDESSDNPIQFSARSSSNNLLLAVPTIHDEEDPFVRRFPLSDLEHTPWIPSQDQTEVVKLPDHIVSPLFQRRCRKNALPSSSSSPSLSSPTPPDEVTHSNTRRRTRKTGTSMDIEEVKELTSRLNLQTRRPSVNAWKHTNFIGESPKLMVTSERESLDTDNSVRWTRGFKDKINSSLDWLRTELTSMREQDAILARKLLNVRKDLHKVKLQKSTLNHQLLLDEAMEMEEERDELQQVSDTAPDLFSPTLKQYGVTRMNLHSRRFSVF